VSPVLKHKQQRGVTCLAWRPFAASELAVGGLAGIFIW
jgi:aladin